MIVGIANDGLRIHVVYEGEGKFHSWGEYPGVAERVELQSFFIKVGRDPDLPKGEAPAEIIDYVRAS